MPYVAGGVVGCGCYKRSHFCDDDNAAHSHFARLVEVLASWMYRLSGAQSLAFFNWIIKLVIDAIMLDGCLLKAFVVHRVFAQTHPHWF
jgi:hypothetical protein